MPRPIVFLSDYGVTDEFVGTCHAVIARLAPEVTVHDLTHGIPPQNVLRGARVLAGAIPYAPEDAVFLAIVDPGVGSGRKAIVVETPPAVLVGPDNGILSLAWETLGGVKAAYEITSPEVILDPVSETFHGRDVFAPAAARVAAGLQPSTVGPSIDPEALVRIEASAPRVEPGRVHSEVIGIDRFGNVQLSARERELVEAGGAEAVELEIRCDGRTTRVRKARTFADVSEGSYAAIIDSGGWLAIARNRGNAAEGLGVTIGTHVVIVVPAGVG